MCCHDSVPSRGLIQELADYEKMPDGPKITAEQLQLDGFGPHKYFHCRVTELQGKVGIRMDSIVLAQLGTIYSHCYFYVIPSLDCHSLASNL